MVGWVGMMLGTCGGVGGPWLGGLGGGWSQGVRDFDNAQ